MSFNIGDIVTAKLPNTTIFQPGNIGIVEEMTYRSFYKDYVVRIKLMNNDNNSKQTEFLCANEIERYIPTTNEICKYNLQILLKVNENDFDNIYNITSKIYFSFGDIMALVKFYIQQHKYMYMDGKGIYLDWRNEYLNNHPIYTPEEILTKNKQVKQNTLALKSTNPKIFTNTGHCNTWEPVEGVYMNKNSTVTLKSTNLSDFTYETFKSTNKKTGINKITTVVTLSDDRIGKATCNESEYDETLGVLNAFANAVCKCKFENIVKKHIKKRQAEDLQNRTCRWCGSIFKTAEELKEHEQWHKNCRRNKKERYKIRKRAKEILIEETAKKLAKDMSKNK